MPQHVQLNKKIYHPTFLGNKILQFKTTQSGNVLFLILIAVALFASLSYAITKSSGGGKTNTTAEKAQLSQGVVDNYIAAINGAIMRMQMRGCLAIDYKKPTEWGAEDHKCQIFHPQGGGVSYQNIPLTNIACSGTTCPGIKCNNWTSANGNCSGYPMYGASAFSQAEAATYCENTISTGSIPTPVCCLYDASIGSVTLMMGSPSGGSSMGVSSTSCM